MILEKESSVVNEGYCNEDRRCITAVYWVQYKYCFRKYTSSGWHMDNDTKYEVFTEAGASKGPCPGGIRFRDLCIQRSLSNGESIGTARNYCRTMGGHLLRPFDYKKWSFTNIGGNSNFNWRIDLDSDGHDGSWKTETDKTYPEMWQWDTTWSGVNGPVGVSNCKFGLLKAADRVENAMYYGGKLTCDGGTAATKTLCESRKLLTFHRTFIYFECI